MPTQVVVRPLTDALRCAACHDDLDASRWSCEVCAAVMHPECARGLGRCATLGCRALPPAPRVRRGARSVAEPQGWLFTLVPWVSGVLTFLWPLWFAAVCKLHYLVAGPYSTHIMNYQGPGLGTLLLFFVASVAVGPAVGHLWLATTAHLRGVPGRHHLRAVGGAITGLIASVVVLFFVAVIMG